MEQTILFKKAKTWNMVHLVLSTIGTVISLIGLPALINPTNSVKALEKTIGLIDDPKMTETLEQSIKLTLSPVYRIYSLALFVLGIILLIFYFLANQKLKQQINVSKVPYYIYLGTVILSIIITFAQGNFAVSAIAISVIRAIPVILVLIYLFKLDTDEE